MSQMSYNFSFESYVRNLHVKFPPTPVVPPVQPHPSLYAIVPPARPVRPAQPRLHLEGKSYSELTWIKIDDAARAKLNRLTYSKTEISSYCSSSESNS